ncbi:MAG TPA: DUF4231 domain-containing protein [Blastococcus sp.]|jgi:Protein of unknown function (DUF4231)
MAAPRSVLSIDSDPGGPAWDRLVDQLDWYDRKSSDAQRAFKRVKVTELVIAAAIPVMAGTSVSQIITAALGGAVVLLEAVQQLYQWQTNWVQYRSTAEALKHEKFLYLAVAGPYATGDRRRLLAERLEGLISQEHAKWTQSRAQGDSEGHPAG